MSRKGASWTEGELSTEVVTRMEAETEEVGLRLAATLSNSDVVYLTGELGAGKTALARGLARGRGARSGQVASPTFAILHEYAGEDGRIVLRHLDLYRLEDRPAELEVLGLPEAVEGAPIAVEWPRTSIRAFLPPTVEIDLTVEPDGARRIRVLSPKS